MSTIFKILILLAVLFSFMNCVRKDKIALPLAVNSDTIMLDTSSGVEHILVYSTGNWSVDFVDSINNDLSWISIDKKEGSGNGEIVFSYSRNLGVTRSATLLLSSPKKNKKIFIIQNGISVDFSFTQRSYTLPKEGLATFLPLAGDIGGDLNSIKLEYLYDDETVEPWVTLDTLTKKGFKFTSLDNDMTRDRSVRIYLTVIDGNNNELSSFVDIKQSLTSAYLLPESSSSLSFVKEASKDTLLLNTNIGAQFDNVEKNVDYAQGSGWIDSIALVNENQLIVGVRDNNSGENRNATINLTLNGKGGELVDQSFLVFQSGSSFQTLDYEYIRSQGTADNPIILEEPLRSIEGYVISDAGNKNMETNPALTFKTKDFEESLKTAYIESLDGKYGFRLKFNNKNDNTLKRYEKVIISVDGLSLTKEEEPERYTISGLTSSSVLEKVAGNPDNLVAKNRSIADLTDEDVYTFVTLEDVSISVPYGSYGNTNRGYVLQTAWNTQGVADGAYVDAIPTNIFDKQGNNMNVLVNFSSPWVFTDLPKNSGAVSGIITHSKLIRFGTDGGFIGRYQIRPLNEHDINMESSPVATSLVEWNWLKNNNEECTAGSIVKDEDNHVLPFIGTGKLYPTIEGANMSLGAYPICHGDPNSKALANAAFTSGGQFWNATTNTGEGFILEFSTDGISAQNMVLNFSIGGGSGNDASSQFPNQWDVEYSFDGANYATVLNSNFTVRPLSGWNLDRKYMNPGLISNSVKLPSDILNKTKVYIKIKARSNVYSTASSDGADAGQLDNSAPNCNIRFGNIAVQYIN